MITLYQRTDCPFCWKVRIAMAELGLTFQEVATSLGEKHPSVIALSPTASVPLLVDGDVCIWDSAVILEYLDSRYGDRRLFGTEPARQAAIRQLQVYSDKLVGPCLRELVFEKRSKPSSGWDLDKIANGETAWRECMAWLEKNMPGGSGFTAADCALAARFGVAEAYEAGVEEVFPRLKAWFEGVKKRPSWRQAYPVSFIRAD